MADRRTLPDPDDPVSKDPVLERPAEAPRVVQPMPGADPVLVERAARLFARRPTRARRAFGSRR